MSLALIALVKARSLTSRAFELQILSQGPTGSVKTNLIQRLQLDDGRAVVAAHPEGDRRRRIVHEDPADVRLPRKKVFGELAALGIEPRNAIRPHRADPYFSVFIRRNVIGSTPGRRQFPFLDLFGLRIEHADSIRAVFGKAEPVLRIHPAAA